MNRKIIVTDLTRFTHGKEVCIAGTDRINGECIRPMPYLQVSICQELNILPGAILSGHFTEALDREGPHQEDCEYENLEFHGPCSTEEFKRALEFGLFNSVQEGFGTSLPPGQKHIPVDQHGNRSIISITCSPEDLEVIEDSWGKIRINFDDESGENFRNISITDLGFFKYALKHHERNDLIALNEWIHNQAEVFLRLGLSRKWTPPDGSGRTGYWIQANGIYTFPDYHADIRSYS